MFIFKPTLLIGQEVLNEVKVLNDILTAIDKKQYCAALFFDLAKAFDSVNHHILIGRLDSLTNYFSVCHLGGPVVRASGSLSMGVPQG